MKPDCLIRGALWATVPPNTLGVVGGLGKLGFFSLTLVYALAGDVPMRMALNAAPDLVFAWIFLSWARATPSRSRAR